MPRKRRLTREESKARTRSDLLRAASRLFLRNGFVATSLSEIAEEAALTKGAVYSNFESKEDLFLALLQDRETGRWAANEELAPSDVSKVSGRTADERARAWGRHASTMQPSARQLALFLEMNAFALRNERTRELVGAHNREFFTHLGTQLAELLDAPEADVVTLGLVAQSLYVGLQMHEAFMAGGPDADVFEQAYALLAHLARTSATA